jgi:hypothetical protein
MDELIVAVPEASCPDGSSSRMMAIPSGTTPAASPWRPRATINGVSDSAKAPMTDPAIIRTKLMTSIGRLPSRSPRRPTVGVATAPVNRVTVTAHEVFAADACKSSGSWGFSGTMMLCIKDTTMPADARTITSLRFAPSSGVARGGLMVTVAEEVTILHIKSGD